MSDLAKLAEKARFDAEVARASAIRRNGAMAADYQAGRSMRAIARDAGLSLTAVEKALERMGVHTPTPRPKPKRKREDRRSHQAHASNCWCLNDSSECCRPGCACHAEQTEVP